MFSQAETKHVTGWVADGRPKTHSQVAASISSVDLENTFCLFHLIYSDEDHQSSVSPAIIRPPNGIPHPPWSSSSFYLILFSL